jgi:hypothetical protein
LGVLLGSAVATYHQGLGIHDGLPVLAENCGVLP